MPEEATAELVTRPSDQPKPEVATPTPTQQTPQTPRRSLVEPTEFYGLLKAVVVDTGLTPEQKKSLIDELRKSTPASDRWTFRWAIWILGLVVVITIVALWSLSTGKHDVPDGLVAIGSAAAGGLAGLLTPGRNQE